MCVYKCLIQRGYKALQALAVALVLPFQFVLAAPPELINLREQTRTILQERHCANCHTPGLPTTRSRALMIYNLSNANWFSNMSDEQLRRLQHRLTAKLTRAELMEMGETHAQAALSPAQRETVEKFVSQEIRNRSLNPIEKMMGQ